MPITPSFGIRLVAIDLDGTLLNSRKELPAGAAEVFKAARRVGLLISIVTGRSACSIREVERLIRISGPHASSGGALVCGNRGRPVYARYALSKEDIRQVQTISRRWNLALFIQNANQILMEDADRYFSILNRPYYSCKVQACRDILNELHFQPLKVSLIGDLPEIEHARSDFIQCDGRFHITSAGEEDIELTRSGVNKGSALRKISEVTGVPLKNIMAIGDSPNDLSMFQEAGLSVVMGNAPQEVKETADIIAPSNNEGGVLWAIENLALPALQPQ